MIFLQIFRENVKSRSAKKVKSRLIKKPTIKRIISKYPISLDMQINVYH